MTEVSIDQLRTAVERMHDCKATFRFASPVKETFKGATVWEGTVHAFDVDHDKTYRCYAWSSPIEGSERRKFYAVLAIPPVVTATDAVRAAIVADIGSE